MTSSDASRDALMTLIEETRAARADAERDHEAAQKLLRDSFDRIAQLRDEERVLHSMFVRRYPSFDSGRVEDDTATASDVESWTNDARTVAVEKAIKLLNETMPTVHPRDIERVLREHGRSDDRDQIGGATAHLNRTHKIHSMGRGRWVIGPDPSTTPGATADTATPGTVAAQRDGGDDHADPPATAQDHGGDPGREARDRDRQTDERVAIQF